jgi:hypothetical protein
MIAVVNKGKFKDEPNSSERTRTKDGCQGDKAFEICDFSNGRGDGIKIIIP